MSDSNKRTYSKTAFLNAYTLGTFAIAAALILGLVYVGTKDRIDASRTLAEQSALLEVIGDYPHSNDLLIDRLELTSDEINALNTNESSQIYVIRNQGRVTGFIFPATAPDGYSGNINILVGLSVAGQLLGVRVIEHKETPGLGDKVDLKKSDWILSFTGKSLSNPSIEGWAVTKDGGNFDSFTGATITPRAMVRRILSVLEYYQLNRPSLIERAELSLASAEQENDHN